LPRRPRFELIAGPRLMSRWLAFDSDPDQVLTAFRTAVPTPAFGIKVAWFPLPGPWGRLGLVAAAEMGRAMRSQSGRQTYHSPNSDLQAGIDVRLAGTRFDLDIDLGVGLHRFTFVPASSTTTHPHPVPDVSYRYVHPGLALRAHLPAGISLAGNAHYRQVFSAGKVASRDWFPDSRILGFDAGVHAAYRFTAHVSAALGIDARLYDFSGNRAATVGRTTAGASDFYRSVWMALIVQLGDTSR
jgi:hypothetical protein